MNHRNILITNDDGIHSPGLLAAVEAVVEIGEVTVIAPSQQQTGMGRSITGDVDARLTPIDYRMNGVKINAYHCECSPALIIRHSLNTLYATDKPDLLISGINYGENLGVNITTSGTVGAALEGASFGIPTIAVSKQTDIESHHKYTDQDWQTASHFLRYFSGILLDKKMPVDVEVLKIDVPAGADPSTPWRLTRLARTSYYSKVYQQPTKYSRIGDGRTEIAFDEKALDPDTDVYAFSIDKAVSVTPLSLDSTSETNFSALHKMLDISQKDNK
jgi:5'-nucleotidase